MKLKIIYIVFILIIPAEIWAACGGSTSGTSPNLTAYDTSYDCVNLAVNTDAIENDTVTIPAGESTWTATLNITKGITLIGSTTCTPTGTAGSDSYSISCDDATIITSNITGSAYLINITPSTPGDNPDIEISNLTFDGNLSGNSIIYITTDNILHPLSNIKLHHNNFKNINPGNAIYIHNEVYALIYNNIFDNVASNDNGNSYAFTILGDNCDSFLLDDGDGMTGFSDGKANFIEDNYFINNTYIINNAGEGAKFVARYNNIINGETPTAKIWDVHPPMNNAGSVGAEIYNNYVGGVATSSAVRFAQVGGKTIVYNNLANASGNDGYYITPWSAVTGLPDDVCEGDFCVDAEGGVHMSDSYIFNNTRLDGTTLLKISEADDGDCITEDIDWWDDYGVGDTNFIKNVTANRNLTTCTTDDVYWETDTKKLYRCTLTNTWTKVYEPYTYPHSLRGEVAPDTSTQTGRMGVDGIGGSTPGRNAVTIPGSTPGRMGVVTH